jgi:hypothetical protein
VSDHARGGAAARELVEPDGNASEIFGLAEEALDQITCEVQGSLSVGPFDGRKWPLRFRPGSFEEGIGVTAANNISARTQFHRKGDSAKIVRLDQELV